MEALLKKLELQQKQEGVAEIWDYARWKLRLVEGFINKIEAPTKRAIDRIRFQGRLGRTYRAVSALDKYFVRKVIERAQNAFTLMNTCVSSAYLQRKSVEVGTLSFTAQVASNREKALLRINKLRKEKLLGTYFAIYKDQAYFKGRTDYRR